MLPVFSFPFQPYQIQEKFMKELYFTIEDRKLGIFESPTGTGKSLSICCGTLQWLKDEEKKKMENLTNELEKINIEISQDFSSNDWLQEEYEKIKKKQKLVELQKKLDKFNIRNDMFLEMKKRVAKLKSNNNSTPLNYTQYKQKNEEENKESVQDTEEDRDIIIEEFEKEDSDSEADEVETHEDDSTKIYISSRTHSQLSQFVGEIKRTIFNNNIRVVTLASRQHYCINSEVNKLKNVNLINERCLDMQKSKPKPTSVGDDGKVVKKTKTNSCTACPYYKQSNITKLKEKILVDIMDMEDLVIAGKQLKACPYYASRMALDDTEVVLISHAGIVSSGARSGISLKLQNNVLIMDEAHGLTAALENAHSAPVSAKQLYTVKTYLQFYINKYSSRLSSRNLLSLNQINFVVAKLLGMIKTQSNNSEEAIIYTLEDFVIKAEIDHLNLRPLVEFCRNTRLAPKLHGFSMKYSQQMLEQESKKNAETKDKKKGLEAFLKNISKKKEPVPVLDEVKPDLVQSLQAPVSTSAGSGLYAILDLLEMLCARSENGRVLAQKGEQNAQLKYLLLNPAENFAQVVKQCRSVILAGGTMEPISEFQSLLAGNENNINIVRCDHVVPPDNVIAVCLTKGPTSMNLNFSYEHRNSSQLLSEVGGILRNICNIVPGGIVCFLPSYSYEKVVYDHLINSKVFEAIKKKKAIFREPKSAAEVEQVLQKFASAVRNKNGEQNGALLLSVVGGKLSEGLNFSDDLGRCVIVMGMPYPNVKSPELQEKMSYLCRVNGGSSGNIYYENLCMKSVNQCIGRAVRHANDYACVLLVDERYSKPQTITALPSFVQKSLLSNCNFGSATNSIAKFFSKHKCKNVKSIT